MTVGLYTHDQLVQIQAAAVQANSPDLVDFTPGSIELALLEGNASVSLWEQALILQVMALTRAATSNGADLDTWMADLFFHRLPALAATGSVTFSRYTPTLPVVVPAGITVTTADSTQAFQITIDTTNPAWSPSLAGYQLTAGQASVTVPVKAQVAGSLGNVVAGAISLVSNSVSVDTTTNVLAFTNGLDAESDAAFRLRFRGYIASLSSATPSAILFAAQSVQQNVKTQLVSNYPSVGFYTLYVDDGSGSPPDAFVAAEYAAAAGVTAEGVQPIVVRFTHLPVSINADISSPNLPASEALVSAALTAYVASLPGGGRLSYLQLPSIIAAADPTITSINSLTINGAQADVVAGQGGLLFVTSVTVS